LWIGIIIRGVTLTLDLQKIVTSYIVLNPLNTIGVTLTLDLQKIVTTYIVLNLLNTKGVNLIEFASVSTTFLFDYGTVTTVWYLLLLHSI
jgi:hypothetical protein